MQQLNDPVPLDLRFHGGFSQQDIKELEDLMLQYPPVRSGVVRGESTSVYDEATRKSKTSRVPPRNPFTFKLMYYVVRANEEYFKYPIEKYLNQIDYTVYDEEGAHFFWHRDVIRSAPHPERRKITTIVFLSPPNEYEGCKLYFHCSKKGTFRVDQPQGSMVHFNSDAYHCISPLIRGQRKVIVAWSG